MNFFEHPILDFILNILSIVIPTILAWLLLKKELGENRKLEIEKNKNEIIQQVRINNCNIANSQIDSLINISFEIVEYLKRIKKLTLGEQSYCLFEGISSFSRDIEKYDYLRNFAKEYRIKTLIEAKNILEYINTCKLQYKILEDTIDINGVKISFTLPEFEGLLDYIIEDTKFCQNIILETNEIERDLDKNDRDRIKYMNDILQERLREKALGKYDAFDTLYKEIMFLIASLYKIKPIISEFIIDYEDD